MRARVQILLMIFENQTLNLSNIIIIGYITRLKVSPILCDGFTCLVALITGSKVLLT